MPPIDLIILLLSATITLTIGAVALIKNPSSLSNKIFGVLSFAWVGWTVTTFLSLHDLANQLQWMRLTMFFVVIMNTALFALASTFPKPHHVLSRKEKGLYAYALVALLITVTPFLFTGVHIGEGGTAVPDPGPGMLIFLIHAAVFALGGLGVLIKRYVKNSGLLKIQLRYILYGSILFVTLVPITNMVFPLLLNESSLIAFSPIFSVIFSAFIGYAIIKHRLFDIRLIVARSVAYVLLLSTLAGLYGLAIFSVSAFFFEDAVMSTGQNLVYIGLAVILAFTFQPLRRFFEHLTDRIFYRDRYESQEVINQIGQVLAAELQLDRILDKSLQVICGNLRVSRGQFVVFNKGKIYQVVHYGPVPDKPLKQSELEELGHGMLVADELEDGNSRKGLLAVHDVRLSLPLKTHEELVGYLLLGDKQSGTIYTNQDIELLGVVDNELAVGIQNAKAYEEIRKFNLTLQRKIEEATTQLRASNKKLKKLDEAKDEFISMASHQLRTPLTTIKGYLSMLLEGDAGQVSEKQQKFIDMAYSGSERMVYLITDLLNVSRMSTGKFIIERSAFDLAQLVKDEVEQLRRYADGKDVALVYEPPTDLPKVHLDENKTRQVVMNLIDNAIYYTPGGGQVTVALKEEGGYIEFKVRDTGIGVPKAEQEKLFSKFFRATNAQKARAEGTGLGLFMVKKVVEGQGGEVLFESTEGKGSTFGFRLKTQVATQAAQATEEVTVEKAADI